MSTEVDLAAHVAAELEWRKNVTEALARIEAQTTATNGRVRDLERDRDRQRGALAVIGVCASVAGGVLATAAGVLIDVWRGR